MINFIIGFFSCQDDRRRQNDCLQFFCNFFTSGENPGELPISVFPQVGKTKSDRKSARSRHFFTLSTKFSTAVMFSLRGLSAKSTGFSTFSLCLFTSISGQADAVGRLRRRVRHEFLHCRQGLRSSVRHAKDGRTRAPKVRAYRKHF